VSPRTDAQRIAYRRVACRLAPRTGLLGQTTLEGLAAHIDKYEEAQEAACQSGQPLKYPAASVQADGLLRDRANAVFLP
jgi:hypothetical protein